MKGLRIDRPAQLARRRLRGGDCEAATLRNVQCVRSYATAHSILHSLSARAARQWHVSNFLASPSPFLLSQIPLPLSLFISLSLSASPSPFHVPAERVLLASDAAAAAPGSLQSSVSFVMRSGARHPMMTNDEVKPRNPHGEV